LSYKLIMQTHIQADMRTYPMNSQASSPEKRKTRSLTFELVEQLSAEIQKGTLISGQKLPTEAAIMARFGVSRTVVREAISKLQAGGLVQTRHGIGTFVLAQTDTPAFRVNPNQLSTLHDVIALLELRISVETEAAALAAVRRTESNLRVMQEAMVAFSNAIEEGRDVQSPRPPGNNTHPGCRPFGLPAPRPPRAREHPECHRRARGRIGTGCHAHAPVQQPRSAQKRLVESPLTPRLRVCTMGHRATQLYDVLLIHRPLPCNTPPPSQLSTACR
jgi:DNA-binding transcriptional regulator YhcF (GntR family)